MNNNDSMLFSDKNCKKKIKKKLFYILFLQKRFFLNLKFELKIQRIKISILKNNNYKKSKIII